MATTFTVPVAFRINSAGDLDIPAGATVFVNDNGEYAGFRTEDGRDCPHRALSLPEIPQATPAAQAHAEEVGVNLSEVEGTGKDGTITKADVAAAAEEQPSGEAQ